MARGYHNLPELTAEKFLANPFLNDPNARIYKTGDIARFRPNGEIEYLGRSDEQVKIRGFRIELGEIEVTLSGCHGVRQAVVLAREDSPGEKRLVAYIVAESGVELKTQELLNILKAKLPDYMVPSAIMLLPSFPLTPNGKTDRRALPAPKFGRGTEGDDFHAPQTITEKQLAEIWSSVLGVEGIARDDNFFDLGGHSILAVRLFALIETSFQAKFPLASLLQAPTLAQLAELIAGKDSAIEWSFLFPFSRAGPGHRCFAFTAISGRCCSPDRCASNCFPEDQPLYGLQSRGLLGKPAHRTIEEMAADYIAEIRRVQPKAGRTIWRAYLSWRGSRIRNGATASSARRWCCISCTAEFLSPSVH